MKKKLLFLFIALAIALLTIGISASDYSENDVVEMWNMSSNSRDNVVAFLFEDADNEGFFELVISGTGNIRRNYFPWKDYKDYISKVTINDGVNMNIERNTFREYPALRYVKLGNGVTEIQNSAFAMCYGLESVNVSERLDLIDANAFINCKALREINGIKYLRFIGVSAFQECDSLITFEADVVEKLDNAAFRGCDMLEYVSIKEGLFYIGNDTFSSCHMLKSVTGMEFTEYIGYNAFRDCDTLESITLGQKIHELLPSTFANCRNLYEINILGPISNIPQQMFRNCVNLKHVFIAEYEEPIVIEANAFQGCYNLTFFANQREIQSIGMYAFAECRSLIGINLGSSLERIEAYAFANCQSLKEIYIPYSTQYVDTMAFSRCPKLTVYAPKNISKLTEISDIVHDCSHVHFEEYLCEDKSHNHQFGSHGYDSKFEWAKVPNTELVQMICVCPCGASTFEYEIRHEEHIYAVEFNGEYHTFKCYCGNEYSEEHSYIECVCICGATKFSMEFDDFSYSCKTDHSIYNDEGIFANIFVTDLVATFDKNYYGEEGYRTAKAGDAISLMLNDSTRLYGLDVFVGIGYGSLKITAYNEMGEIVVDRILDVGDYNEVSGDNSNYIAFLGGVDVKYVDIETLSVEGEFLIISELDFTLRPDGVKIDMSHEKVDITAENNSWVEINEELLQFLKDMVTSVDVGLGKIELDVKSTNKVTGKKENVTIAIQDVTTDENAELGKRTYDIIVNDKHGNPILPPEESYENGEITLTFKFQAGFKKENIKIYYIDDEGKKHSVDIESYDPMTGEVVFKTNHLSTYEISVDVAEKVALVNNSIEYLGYSVNEKGGKICFGFKLNKDAIASYDNIGDSALEIGIVMAAYDKLKGAQPLDSNGNTAVIDGCHILKLNVDKSVAQCEVILTDFTEEYFDDGLVVSAYTKSDVGITYYQENNASNIVYSTVYKPTTEEE